MNATETMDMVPLSEFTPELILAAPELPPDIAESYIRQAAIELCQQAVVVKEWVEVEAQAGVDVTLLEPSSESMRIWRIIKVCDWRGKCYNVEPGAPCFVDGCSPRFDLCQGGCGIEPAYGMCSPSRRRVWFEHPNELHLDPPSACDADVGYRAHLWLIPERNACELPEILFQEYAPCIVSGALRTLYAMPKRPWSDSNEAARQRREFYLCCARAHGDGLIGKDGGVIRMKAERIL
jgi:hypothetical protein